ncbi:MAG: hypothetical protein LBB09_00125 [Rickettsiales bacterium]|jgi:hypothetical protein|nr:hypothetical protein [Rickettsiales bacterium]
MIRNFLYSLCLHFLIAVGFIIGVNVRLSKIDKNAEFQSIEIRPDIDLKRINITLKKDMNFLTLGEKLRLYEYLIEYEKARKKIETSPAESEKVIEQLRQKKLGDKNFNILDYVNVDGLYNANIVFLGPADYNRHVRGTELEKRVLRGDGAESDNGKNDIKIHKIDRNNIFSYRDLQSLNDIVFRQNQLENLSKTEIFEIQEQLSYCYRDAMLRSGDRLSVPISIELNLNRDGRINTKRIRMTIMDKYNRHTAADYDASIGVVKSAIVLCNPLKNLPSAKYQSWGKVNFVFED